MQWIEIVSIGGTLYETYVLEMFTMIRTQSRRTLKHHCNALEVLKDSHNQETDKGLEL